jgi:hypothetical protein
MARYYQQHQPIIDIVKCKIKFNYKSKIHLQMELSHLYWFHRDLIEIEHKIMAIKQRLKQLVVKPIF